MMTTTAHRETELLKGSVELLVLALLTKGVFHGYRMRQELNDRSNGYVQVSFGTLYPLLGALERRRLIGSVRVKVGPVRERRVYAITAAGRRYLDEKRLLWSRYAAAVTLVLSSLGMHGRGHRQHRKSGR